MLRLLVAALLFLTTNETLADVKNKEKAKFDLISSIEVMVNIDECRKGILNNADSSVLPRACNSLPYLSKYFFDPSKDKNAIHEYLNNEEAKVTEAALKLVRTFNISKMGKMTLSPKCVKNKDPVDLDLYLRKIKGERVHIEEAAPNHVESRVPGPKNDLITMPIEPRNPAMSKVEKKDSIDEQFENETRPLDLEFERE